MAGRDDVVLHAWRLPDASLEHVVPRDVLAGAQALVWTSCGVSVHQWDASGVWRPSLPDDAVLVRVASSHCELRWARLPIRRGHEAVLGGRVLLSQDSDCFPSGAQQLPSEAAEEVLDWWLNDLRLREFVAAADDGNAVVVEDVITVG